MLRELIAPARMEVAFRQYESQPLAADQVRVKSRFGAAKHGSEMAMFPGLCRPPRRLRRQVAPVHTGKSDGQLSRRAGQYMRR